MHWRSARPVLTSCSAITLTLAAPALAQEAPAPSAPAAGAPVASADTASGPASSRKQVYEAAFFAQFSPRTAADMVRQVPGFSLRQSDDARGLGQASANVLINGARMTGKSEDATTQLSRIPANNVVRIELVDAATLDVPGLTGQVANLIVKTDALSGSFSWSPEFRTNYTDPIWKRGEISLRGKQGPVEFTLGFTSESHRGGAGGRTEIRGPTGALTETRDDVILSFYDSPRLTGNFKFDGPGTSEGNLNLSYRWAHFRYNSDDTRLRVGGQPTARAYDQDERAQRYEVGGDYAFALGPGRLKLIGLLRGRSSPYEEQTIVTFTDGSPRRGDRYASQSETAERIARVEYDWKLLGADFQLSGEAAFNRLDLAAELFELNPAGEFVAIPFPQGTGGVREARYESLLSFKRQLTPKLSLQVTGGAEFSRLSQSGAATNSREFWRPKGSLSLAWAAAKGFDVSFKLRRRVGQLDFFDFLGRVFLEDNNQNSGNAELVPPQSWEAELELKKALGPWGTTTLRLYEYRIADFVDIIPIGLTGESPGNLDGARRRGLEWTSTFQFAPLGWKGAKLDLKIALEDSSIIDPLTLTARPISNTLDRNIEANLRWDIPKSDWALGAYLDYYHFQNYYRLSEVGLGWEGPIFAGAFIENKDVFGLTVRASFNNLLDGRNLFDRTVYAGRRNVSPVLFTESRDRLIGPIFSFSVKGNF